MIVKIAPTAEVLPTPSLRTNFPHNQYFHSMARKFVPGMTQTPLARAYDNSRTQELLLSVGMGDISGVQIALDHDADPNARDEDGVPPVIHAVETKNLEIVKLLISVNANVNVCSRNRRTPLHLAIKSKNLEMVKTLIDAGADVNAKDYENYTPIIQASEMDDSTILKVLLSQRPHLSTRNSHGDTALHRAVYYNRLENVRLLINVHADVNLKNWSTMTPLMLAAQLNNSSIMKLLISKGADLNAKDSFNKTALYFAAMSRQVDNARVLVEAGADVNVANKDGRTAIRIAFHFSVIELIDLLLAAGATVDGATAKISPLVPSDVIRAIVPEDTHFWLTANNDAPMLAAELAGGLDPNTKTKNGMTLLHWACAGDAPECVQLLLEAGADPHQCSLENDTIEHTKPIHYALTKSHDSCRILKTFNADLGLDFSDEESESNDETA